MKIWSVLNIAIWLTVFILFVFTEGYEKERNILLAISGASTAGFFFVKIINSSRSSAQHSL